MEPVSIATGVSEALRTVVTDTIATMSAVAPIAITIFGTMLAWRYGMRFFKSLSK